MATPQRPRFRSAATQIQDRRGQRPRFRSAATQIQERRGPSAGHRETEGLKFRTQVAKFRAHGPKFQDAGTSSQDAGAQIQDTGLTRGLRDSGHRGPSGARAHQEPGHKT